MGVKAVRGRIRLCFQLVDIQAADPIESQRHNHKPLQSQGSVFGDETISIIYHLVATFGEGKYTFSTKLHTGSISPY